MDAATSPTRARDGRRRDRSRRLGRPRALDLRAAPAGHGDAAAVVPDVRAAGARTGRERRQPDGLQARLDGADVGEAAARDRQGSRARARERRRRRPQGAHPGPPGRVFGDTVDEAFTLHVDTQRPELAINRVPPGWRPITRDQRARRARLDARAQLRGRARHRAPEVGRVRARSRSARRPHHRAPDRERSRGQPFRDHAHRRQDGTPPRIHLDRVPAVVGTPHPTLRGSLDDASPVIVQAKLDGVSVALRGPDGKALLGAGAVKGRFSLPLQRLSQGVHRLAITVIDSAGNTTTAEAGPFTVDSTERLRSSTVIGLGARGADVVQLERRLKAFGTSRARSRASTTPVPKRPCAPSRPSTTCRSRASPRRSCSSSARSASSCTSSASASS